MAEHKESVLLYRILSEALSGEELESAVEQVRASGALQEELGGHMYVDTLLKLELGAVRIPERLPREIASRIRADEAKRRVAKPGGSRRRAHPVRRFRWGAWISVAACLAIIAGTVIVNVRQSDRISDVMLGTLSSVRGVVEIEQRGNVITVRMEQVQVWAGDTVRTSTGAAARFLYDGEESVIDVTGDTKMQLWIERGAKRVDIPQGTIECDIAPQPEGREMVIDTPHAKAVLRGTRFRLAVDESSSHLEVMEGLVSFTDTSSERTVEVAAGRTAFAGNDGAISMENAGESGTPIRDTVPPPEGYAFGPIIFEDDFDEGLGKWDVLAGTHGRNLTPAGEAAGEIARLVSMDRKTFVGVLGEYETLNAVKVTAGTKDPARRVVSLRTKKRITEEAFSVKLLVSGGCKGVYLSPFQKMKTVSTKRHDPTSTYPGSFCMRWDCIPAGVKDDGTPLLEIRRHLIPLRPTGGKKESLLRTAVVTCDDRRFGIAFSRGALTYPRAEIRALLEVK